MGQSEEPKIGRTIHNDFKQTKISEEFKTEYKELTQYFLTDASRKSLSEMHALKKIFVLPWWLLKAMYFRLTPFRRILLFIGIIALITTINFTTNGNEQSFNFDLSAMVAGLVFLFILALELKDKLLAKTELEEGRAIQQALMPEKSPKVPGWDIWLFTRSANEVGGDLLDFIQINKNKFGIAVGDVAGKGLSAALLMAKLQSSIRALVYDNISLNELGKKLNGIFYKDSPSKIFASMIYLQLNTDSNLIKWINAGHYPPLLINADKIEELQKDAPALGILFNSEFVEQSTRLEKGNFMLIYSDGLIEAQNESGEFFSEDKLIKLLKNINVNSSEQLGNFILSEVDLFTGKAPAHDDLTLVVLKRTDSA